MVLLLYHQKRRQRNRLKNLRKKDATKQKGYDVQLCYGAKNYYIGTYQRKVRLP